MLNASGLSFAPPLAEARTYDANFRWRALASLRPALAPEKKENDHTGGTFSVRVRTLPLSDEALWNTDATVNDAPILEHRYKKVYS